MPLNTNILWCVLWTDRTIEATTPSHKIFTPSAIGLAVHSHSLDATVTAECHFLDSRSMQCDCTGMLRLCSIFTARSFAERNGPVGFESSTSATGNHCLSLGAADAMQPHNRQGATRHSASVSTMLQRVRSVYSSSRTRLQIVCSRE